MVTPDPLEAEDRPNDPQCATITFDTGVAQGSALSPLLFLIFMNALLGLIIDRGQKLRVSHGLKCGVQLRRKGANQGKESEESVGQFNLTGFVDDLSLFAQTLGGAQALLEAVQEFELWSGLKVNRKKPCGMIVEKKGTSQRQRKEALVYMGQEVTFLAPSTACRYLGVWVTPTGDMSNTKERILKRTEEAPRHQTCSLYQPAWNIFGLSAQELCHLQRCLKHEDVARQLTLRDLHLTCEQWACDSLLEITEEMEMWKWDSTLDNEVLDQNVSSTHAH